MRYFLILLLSATACAQTWFSHIAVKPTTNSCGISWTTAVPTIDHIQYGLTKGSYTKGTTNGSTYSVNKSTSISSLAAGTTYHLRIAAGDVSQVWVTSLDFTCTTPSLTAQHSVKLNWGASISPGVAGYRVYRSTISGGYYALVAAVSGLTYTDQSVQSGTAYYYVVKAMNTAGALSAYSSQVKALIP